MNANLVKRLLVFLLCGTLLTGPETLYAANNLWTQSDWSGGGDTLNTTGHDPAQNGQSLWNKYYAKDPNVEPSVPGQVTLSPLSASWIQTTDNDFNGGDRINLQITGTGDAASLTLNPYIPDLGTGVDGDLLVDGTTVTLDGVKNYNKVTVQNGGIIQGNPGTTLSSPTGLQLSRVLTPGPIGLFYYVVTAVDAFGFETPRSPSTDINNSISSSNNSFSIYITWSPVSGAAGYRVYRRGSGSTGYASPSLICNVTDPAVTSCTDSLATPLPGAPPLNAATTPTAVVSPSGGTLPDGNYFYVVTAIDFNGMEATPGTERTVPVASGTGTSSVSLSWPAVAGAAGYRVYRSNISGIYDSYNNPASGLVCESGATILTCTDTLATPIPVSPPRSYNHPLTGGFLHLKVTGTLSVDGTSSITMSGGGFSGGIDTAGTAQGASGKGPGAAGNRGGGGGYGSPGGSNGNPAFPAAVGPRYGEAVTIPQSPLPGSGGAAGSFLSATAQGGAGGNGGGALRISANQMTVDGSITADGNPGQNASQNQTDPGGGGSGGLVFLEGNTIVGAGGVSAQGGNGGVYSPSTGSASYYAAAGTGGEGRIRISALTASLANTQPRALTGNFGKYESPSRDLGTGGARFSGHTLSWTGQANGGGFKFLIATNNDNRSWIFRGPDGTPEGSAAPVYYTASGTPIWSGHDGDRYIKYKVFLEAPDTDPAHAPVLESIAIGYEYNPAIQLLTSSPYDTTESTDIVRRLQWDETLPAGTGVQLQIRTAPDNASLSANPWYGPSHTTLLTPGLPVQNPGFESCTAGNATPPGWGRFGATSGSGCNATAHTGTWAVRGISGEYFYQSFTLAAGVAYNFSAWAMTQNTRQTATLLVSSAAGGGTTYCTQSSTSTSWTQIACSYTPASDLTVFLTLRAVASTYYAWFDDVVVGIGGTAGIDTINVADTGIFAVGDRIDLIEGTNPAQEEIKKITAIDPANNALTLDSLLAFDFSQDSIVTKAYQDSPGTEIIHPIHRDGVDDRWIQYRLILTTEDRLATPVFLENRIGYLPSAGVYQPDGVIGTNGDGIYGTFGSGEGGTAVSNIDPGFRGGVAVHDVEIQNDGTIPSGTDTYTITWNPVSDPSGNWTVTLDDTLASGIQVSLAPGAVRNYTLKMIPSPYAPGNSSQTVTLNIRSENEYHKADSIRATAAVNPIYQADGILDNGDGDGSGSGPGYDLSGAGNGGTASRNAEPGVTAIFPLILQNEGNMADGYLLSQTTSCIDAQNRLIGLPPQWKIYLNDGTTDVDITSASWTTPALPATVVGASISGVSYTLKVLPQGEPVTCDTVLKIESNQGNPEGPRTILDSVKATTILAGTYKIDLWIEGNGDNGYGATGSGAGGGFNKGIVGGTTGTFAFGVQNEGNLPDYFELSWNTPSGWSSAILHQDGSLLCSGVPGGPATCLVPPSDLDCPYKSGSQCLAIPGEVIRLKLQVSPPSSFTTGNESIVIDGKSVGSSVAGPLKVDSVLARVWATTLNIAVSSVTSQSATLTWTRPSWTANIYDLRYSTKEIIEDGLVPGADQVNFSNAAAVPSLPKPNSAQDTGSFTVNQLYAATPYYFALKTKSDVTYTSVIADCSGNGCASGTTDPSTDGILPAAVTDLHVTASTADSATLCWTAPSDDTGSEPVTGYLLKYSTKNIVDDPANPGMGEIRFSEAAAAGGMGIPKTPGVQECYKVHVANILSGGDGLPGTVDDLDRTPNSRFFFALKSEDENHNLSPISSGIDYPAPGAGSLKVSGQTAMFSNAYNMVSVPKVPIPASPLDVFGDDVGSPLYLYWWDSRGVGHDRGCYDGLPTPFDPNGETIPCIKIGDPDPDTGLATIVNQEIQTGEKRSGIGKGYFLWSPRLDIALDAPGGSSDTPTTVCLDDAGQPFPDWPSTSCYIFPLQEGWNMVGNPFGKEVPVSAIQVRQTRQQGQQTLVDTTSFLNAVTARNWMGNAVYTYTGTSYTYEFCDSTGCTPVLQPWKGYWIWLHKQGDAGGDNQYDLLIPSP